jgi:hypothetical protein
MANRPEYIQLEPGDDAASVRDRLSFIRGQRVLLIWPEEGTILTRKLDLVLIQREAMRRAIRLALVTHDAEVIRNAEELNISTFETIGSSERGRWQRGRSKVFTTRFQRPKDEPIPDDLKEVATRIRADEDADARRWRPLRLLLALLVLLGIGGGVAYLFVPSATVTLTPAAAQVNASAQITADPSVKAVDVENRLIPAIRLRVPIDDTSTVETTGEKPLGDALSTGSVVFVNQKQDAVTIPAGTTVTTSAGTPIQFRTTKEAQLSGGIGFQIEVPIEALPASAGDAGNVGIGMINTIIGPLAGRLTVRNLAPTTGGSSQTQRVVAAADKDRLVEIVRQQLQSRAYVEMKPRLTQTQFIIPETIRIAEERDDWKTFSAKEGDTADSLSLNMHAVVEAVVVDQQFGQQITLAQMSNQVGRGQYIKPESISYEMGGVDSVDDQTGRITFSMSGSGQVAALIDPETLKQKLAGMTLNDAQAYLIGNVTLQQNTLPQITLSPDWFGRMPILANRITVLLQDAS